MLLKAKGQGLGSLILIIGILVALAVLSGLCWSYSLGSWLTYFHKENHIHFWQCMLLGFVPFLGQASIPFAVITWVLMMFI